MNKPLIDVVAKAVGPNPAIHYVTVFGSRSTVMVVNSRTRRLIATVYRSINDGSHNYVTQYHITTPGAGTWFFGEGLESMISSLKNVNGYVQGKNQNYSRASYKSAVTY